MGLHTARLPGNAALYNFKATVAYRGTAYKGWQIQNDLRGFPTIQEALNKALTHILKEPEELFSIQGSGRTDAGVHARGQVFNFFSPKLNSPPPQRMHKAINAYLPEDIRILHVEQVPMDFHARFSAFSKLYSFQIQLGETADPIKLGLCQHVFQELDLNAMRVSPVKTLSRVEVRSIPGGLEILFDGSGFLYNQCRHMAACLIRVGIGSYPVEGIGRLLELGEKGGRHHRSWPLAKASGLYLEEVRYPVHTDCNTFLYPDAPHDAAGRINFAIMSAEERRKFAEAVRRDKRELTLKHSKQTLSRSTSHA